MSFLLQCEKKECKKVTEVVLDKETNCVHCGDCDAEITNVTAFVKQSLRGMKKYRTPKKSYSSYALQCKNCKKKMTPLLIKDNLHCPECREQHEVTAHFKAMFISNIKNV